MSTERRKRDGPLFCLDSPRRHNFAVVSYRITGKCTITFIAKLETSFSFFLLGREIIVVLISHYRGAKVSNDAVPHVKILLVLTTMWYSVV